MQKRVLILIALVFISCTSWVLIQPSRAIIGTLSGETFHAGYPTSFYTRALNADPARKEQALRLLKSPEAIPVLLDLLNSKDSTLRLTAIEVLSGLGPDAHSVGGDLLKLLSDPDPLIPPVAAAAIPKIGVPAEQAIPHLVDTLDGPAGVPAARAISTYKAAARDTVPVLEKILLDTGRDVELRWNAARTIGKIGADAVGAVPTLVQMLTATDVSIREHAAEALGDIGPAAASSIPELVKLLDDENDRVRRDTVRSLGYMGAAAKDVAPQLVPLLQDKAEMVKAAVQTALMAIDPDLLPKPEPEQPAEPAAKETSPPEGTPPN